MRKLKNHILDIGIVIPELAKYGGAEKLLIECVSRWQYKHKITIYSTKFNEKLLKEHGINKDVNLVKITPYFKGPHSMVLNGILLPKIWEHEIGAHDIYHTHLWPTHLIDLHPNVWFPHEPLRILNDLRYDQPAEDTIKPSRNIHIYPKYSYDEIHDVFLESYLTTLDLFDKLGKPDRIVANSRYSAHYLEEVYHTKVKDIVYPGVNIEDFIYNPPDENIILSVAQLWPHKRIRLIIEAIKYVEDIQLYVVGDGPDLEKLQRTAHKLGVSDRVFFLRGLTNLEVQILFSRCLAVVFVPLREPFGIVALEAMAAGKPLIGVNEGGFTEVVDESCAFLVPPHPLEIAEKIRYLKDNKEIAREMGLAGLKKAKKYTWDRCAQQLLSIIEDTYIEWSKKNFSYTPAQQEYGTFWGIQYYCWYGDGLGASHWNDNPETGGVTDMPLLGYYASSQGSIIQQHLKLLADTGFDFLLLNLHIDNQGINRYEFLTIENIFTIAERINSPLKFAIQICPYDYKKDDMLQLLKTINNNLIKRKHYFKLFGKPLLSFFWTGILDGNKSHIKFLNEHTQNFIKIASTLRMYSKKTEMKKTFNFFDGFCLFSPLEISSPKNWEKLWQKAYDNSEAGNMNLRIITVSPGYDDSHLKAPLREGNPFRTVDRNNGETYRKMIEFTLSQKNPPHLVIVSTFNEFHENTHIEPTKTFGDLYIKMTKDFIIKGKKKWRKIK